MSDKEFGLSRRQMLAGLGTIGVASAGAGLGTTALFSDEESFEGNSVTAGTLDMSVTASVEAANEYWAEQVDLAELEATADGDAVTGIQVSDVKPGDWGIICFEFEVGDNPGYIRTRAEGRETGENGYTEPEPTDGEAENDPDDDDGAGELQDFMLAEVYQNSVDANSDDPRDYVENLDPVTPEGSTLQETYDTFSGGVIMRDGDGEPLEVGSDPEEGTPDGPGSAEWCLLLYVPEDVGNIIQSDTLSFDLVFEAEQVRNNDVPFDGDSAVSETATPEPTATPDPTSTPEGTATPE
ncbi:SipW-dependent-type signal peptide-containing protein [Halosimplex pelagicum]|uniref:SipW-cognate class signal peptide n=1 Tax=Halosimplex pelagicum TaxID=869886 RepID=A0A7D5P5G0_9EURY|nr:SipW-dependent-type signal peptide-containing protein [Halosimplex pelagicum]QLH81243.1 hypothetical protein HZS54_06145 [Halosimplex pelagicum]